MTRPDILVFASARDEQARAFAERHAASGVVRITPEDLSLEGWVFAASCPADATFVASGRIRPAASIKAVLSRLGAVTPDDLPHIHPEDRTYVAAEMSALLLAFLHSLACPVFNRPDPQCLSGPSWRAEQWLATAHQLGIPVRPWRRSARLDGALSAAQPSDAQAFTLTIIGPGHAGQADAALVQHARALADASGAQLLCVQFESDRADARFTGAHLWPDLSDPEIAGQVLALLQGATA